MKTGCLFGLPTGAQGQECLFSGLSVLLVKTGMIATVSARRAGKVNRIMGIECIAWWLACSEHDSQHVNNSLPVPRHACVLRDQHWWWWWYGWRGAGRGLSVSQICTFYTGGLRDCKLWKLPTLGTQRIQPRPESQSLGVRHQQGRRGGGGWGETSASTEGY